MYGHSSHYEPSSLELAKENDAILFCLSPHTMQDSQPLDCTVIGPLKHHWSNVRHKYLQNHPGAIINKYNFCEVFSEAWLLALTPSNVVFGFCKCGIHPFNIMPSQLKVEDLKYLTQKFYRRSKVMTVLMILTRWILVHKMTAPLPLPLQHMP